MRKRRSGSAPQPLGDILYAALKRRGMTAGLDIHAVLKLWPAAVGPRIAAQTRPDGLRAGRLFVRAASSVWVQQLHFLKQEIIEKLNALCGKPTVREILFTVGHIPAAELSLPLQTPPALEARDRKMIEESTAGLADRELAAILRRVMEKEISRRRRLEALRGR